MRKSSIAVPLLVVSLLLAVPRPILAGEARSRVDRVVLYPDMAEITRLAEVAGPDTDFVLPGLTATLLPETVSARVVEGTARVVGVTVEDAFRADAAEGRIRELTRILEDLQDGKRLLETDRENLRKEKELLAGGVSSVFAPDGGKGRPRLTVPEIEASLALYRGRAKALDDAILARDREAREADRKIDSARKELDKIRIPRPAQEKAIRLLLSRPGPCTVAVTYLVPSAGFSPRYNAGLSPAKKALSLELLGEAWQRTGEDWTRVSVVFSTARPGRAAQLPPLPPWDIDFPQPALVPRMKAARPMLMEESRSQAAPEAMADLRDEAPSVAQRFASFEVTLPGRHDLSGVGERKTFSLARKDMDVRVSWRAIPRVFDGAFLSAEGTNESGLPVVAAPAGLFLDDGYVGAGALPDIGEKEPFRIDFGKDDGVSVKRKEISRVREDAGLFSKVKRVRFRCEIEARNSRRAEVHLTVADRVPFPRHKDIAVKDLEITGGGKIGEQGEVAWDLTLPPGEKIKLGISFTVEYPADKEIYGL